MAPTAIFHCLVPITGRPGAVPAMAAPREISKLKTLFRKLTDISSVARNEDFLREALAKSAQDLGFDCYAYLNVQPMNILAVSNYPSEWQARYLVQQYMKIDPVISMARSRMMAFTWAAKNSRQVQSTHIRRFYAEAGDFGIKSGISIPIRTAFGHMSMLTLASHKISLSLEKDIDQVAAVTAVSQLHAKLEQQNIDRTANVPVILTARQAICLRWSAEGKSMRAIATIENMSFATVNFHLNNARKALDAGSLAQATALATKLKLI
jgi:LuxR family transcriptional activator of conjugal transfer of Ti plasmids